MTKLELSKNDIKRLLKFIDLHENAGTITLTKTNIGIQLCANYFDLEFQDVVPEELELNSTNEFAHRLGKKFKCSNPC